MSNDNEKGLIVPVKPKTDPRFIDLGKNGLKTRRVKKDIYLELFSNGEFVGSVSAGSYKTIAEAQAAEYLADLLLATTTAAIKIEDMQEVFDNIKNGLEALRIEVPSDRVPQTFNQDITPTYSFSYYDSRIDGVIAGEVNLFAELHKA